MKMQTKKSSMNRASHWDVLLEVDAYLPWSGGSRTYYHNLYRRLADTFNVRVLVDTSHCAGDETFDLAHSNSDMAILRNFERLPDWKLARSPELLRKLLHTGLIAARTNPGAIHCGDLFPQDLAGALIRRAARVPLLVFVHGDEISQTEGRRLQPKVRNAIYRSADAVIAANRFAYDRLAVILPTTANLTMITPGVDFDLISPGPRPGWIQAKFSLGHDPVILTVGRLVKKKGHATVLRSLPTVIKQVPNLHYLIVGDGPERTSLQILCEELGISPRVHFVGDVPHAEIGDYYRAADVFCMINQQDSTGDIESFGMVFTEANSAAKPVIGGRSGGTDQSILEGETGMLCASEDFAGAAEQLILLLRNPELRDRMGAAGLSRSRRDFDWGSRAAQLYEVHNRITSSKVTPREARGETCRPYL